MLLLVHHIVIPIHTCIMTTLYMAHQKFNFSIVTCFYMMYNTLKRSDKFWMFLIQKIWQSKYGCMSTCWKAVHAYILENATVKNCIEVGSLGNILKICLAQLAILISIHLVGRLSLDLIRREWLHLW